MIKSLQLTNFQSHKDTQLEFDAGVNVIVGGSDTGKTAIIRALRWLVWNRPSGDEFRSNWGGETMVEIEIDDLKLVRLKDKARNEYISIVDLEDPAIGMTTFTAIKTDVPDEITKELNFNETNLQQQLDAPFLLSKSPGEVAQHFNRIARLDQIDTGIKNVSSWIREITQQISSDETRLQNQQIELERLPDIDKLETDVEVLEQMEGQLINAVNNRRKLNRHIEVISEVEVDMEQYIELLSYEELVIELLGKVDERDDLVERTMKFNILISDIHNTGVYIEDQEQILESKPFVDKLLLLYRDRTNLQGRSRTLSDLIHNVSTTDQELVRAKEKTIRLETKFKDALGKYEICPLCGQEVKK